MQKNHDSIQYHLENVKINGWTDKLQNVLTELEYFSLVLSSLAKDTSRVGLQKGNVHVYLGLTCSLTFHPGLTVTIGALMEYSYFLTCSCSTPLSFGSDVGYRREA